MVKNEGLWLTMGAYPGHYGIIFFHFFSYLPTFLRMKGGPQVEKAVNRSPVALALPSPEFCLFLSLNHFCSLFFFLHPFSSLPTFLRAEGGPQAEKAVN